MNTSDRKPKGSEVPRNAVSAFTQELIDDVVRDHYSFRAWRSLLSRSWERSLDDLNACPDRTRSFWWSAAAVAAAGTLIILLTLWKQTPWQAFTASVLWLPWYAGSVLFVLTHIGMVDDNYGQPQQRLLLPNSLSFARLALAPLVWWPCLQLPVDIVAGPIFLLFLAALSMSDLVDGWVARRQGLCTRMGRMLDVLADQALLTFLAVGLYSANAIPGQLLYLLIVRYPLLFIAVFIMFFARGPVSMGPSLLGKVTTFMTSLVLLAAAFRILLSASWPTPMLLEWSFRLLYLLISVNILYLVYRGWRERTHR
jgi:phosphatidylglycerophosphate synthase